MIQACVTAFAPAAPRMMQRAQVQMNMGNKVNFFNLLQMHLSP